VAARRTKKTKATRKKAVRKKTAKKTRRPRSVRAKRSRKKTPRGQKDPGGQPAIDWNAEVCETIHDLAYSGNTVEDMARILKVGKSTLEEAIANEPEIREAYYRGGAQLNDDLRRSQVKFAKRGNATLLKWLGLQRLGQRDVKAVEISGSGEGGAIPVDADLGPVLTRKLVEFLRSRGQK